MTPDDIRKVALGFEGVSEVDHWGRPAFRTRKRIFAVIRPDGLWLYLPEERKEFLFEADPKAFVRYMWGKHPEIIVQTDRVSKKELAALLREAYESALPPPKPAKKEGRPQPPIFCHCAQTRALTILCAASAANPSVANCSSRSARSCPLEWDAPSASDDALCAGRS